MTHLDLFSGIGGFSLAVDNVWDNVEHVFCEIDPFCQQVLKKHWPNSKIYGDIRQLTSHTRSQKPRGLPESPRENIPTIGECDLLTGGFPCQPFSQAGMRRGTNDDRYLWPEMFRVISEFRPEWVIAENVAGLLSIENGMVFEQVCADLERENYEVWPFVIPACAVGAPHRRDRVWIVAHSSGSRPRGKGQASSDQERGVCQDWRNGIRQDNGATGAGRTIATDSDVAHAKRAGHKRQERQTRQSTRHRGGPQWDTHWIEVATWYGRMDDGISTIMDFALKRIEQENGTPYQKNKGQDMRTLRASFQSQAVRETFGRLYQIPDTEVLLKAMSGIPKRGYEKWALKTSNPLAEGFLREMWEQRELRRSPRGWRHNEQLEREHKNLLPQLSYEASLAVAEAWHRVRFTLQNREDQDGYKLEKSRNARLKALGNAIVPQVAMEIMKAIKSINLLTCSPISYERKDTRPT